MELNIGKAVSGDSNCTVLMIAAEASSALYAQRLLEYWQKQQKPVHAFGVGSRAMEALGFSILGRSEELAVVGLQEVVKHAPLIWKTYHKILDEVKLRQPKVALLLDYPEFNLLLAPKLKALGIPVVYYISPQIWAWRTGRVHKIRKVVDRILVLFPFEVDFFAKYDVPATFVGHPLLDEIDPKYFDKQYRRESRSRFALHEQDLVLGLMPGSRHSEIQHHLQWQLECARLLTQKFPQIRPVLLVAPTLRREDFSKALENLDFSVTLLQSSPMEMIHLVDLVLCASGTATLMVGLMEKPMVIMYRMNALTAWFAKRLVTETPFFGMVNLIMGKRVVPELFQEQAEPKFLAQELERYILDSGYRERVCSDLQELKNRLGSRGATSRVAAVLGDYLGHGAPP